MPLKVISGRFLFLERIFKRPVNCKASYYPGPVALRYVCKALSRLKSTLLLFLDLIGDNLSVLRINPVWLNADLYYLSIELSFYLLC